MPPRFRLTAAILASVLLLGASACGSSGGSDGAAPETTSAESSASDGAGSDETTAPSPGSGEAGEGDPSAVKVSDGAADSANTVTFTADDSFDPAELEVGVGDVITFQAADDAGSHAVTFDGSNTYTISGGLTESFTIDAPGTYTASELLTNATMTITVTA